MVSQFLMVKCGDKLYIFVLIREIRVSPYGSAHLTHPTYLTLVVGVPLLTFLRPIKRLMAELESLTDTSEPASAAHRSLADLVAGFQALPTPPRDLGKVMLVVCRRAPAVHEALDRVRLTREEGVPGDEWNRRPPCKLDSQVTVIRHDVAELIANGQSLTVSGDNLIVDLDLSAANLPAGTRLRVGEAIVEMTPMPHDGCAKFQKRFGKDAFLFVQAPATRRQNLRGIHWRVIEPGEVAVGATIEVLSRPNG